MIERDPLEGSICSSCIHMLERIIIPLDNKDYGIDTETFESEGDVVYKHRLCMETALDLDHIVLRCSCYEPKDKGNCLLKIDR